MQGEESDINLGSKISDQLSNKPRFDLQILGLFAVSYTTILELIGHARIWMNRAALDGTISVSV